MSSQQRRSYYNELHPLLVDNGIAVSEKMSYLEYFGTREERSEIAIQGLYLEPSYHEPALVALKLPGLPLLIDPLSKCLTWLRRRHPKTCLVHSDELDIPSRIATVLKEDSVCVVSLNEGAMNPCVLRVCRLHSRARSPTQKLFLLAPVVNPTVTYELLEELYIVDFAVSGDSSREILRNSLGMVLFPCVFSLHFLLGLTSHRCSQTRNEIEEFILESLAGKNGESITSNESAISSVIKAKGEQEAIQRISARAESSLDRVSSFLEHYRSAVELGCHLFELTQRFEEMHRNYSFSFSVFQHHFISAVQRSHQLSDIPKDDPRDDLSPLEAQTNPVASLMGKIEALEVEAEGRFYVKAANREEMSRTARQTEQLVFRSIFCYIGAGVTPVDRLAVATVLVFSIRRGLSQSVACFMRVIGTDGEGVPQIWDEADPPPWLPRRSWKRARVLEDSALPIDSSFLKMRESILQNSEEWRLWFGGSSPGIDGIPAPFNQGKSILTQLLIIWALRPDRLLSVLRESIEDVMGGTFLSLPDTYSSSTPQLESSHAFLLFVTDSKTVATEETVRRISASVDHFLTFPVCGIGDFDAVVKSAREKGGSILLKLDRASGSEISRLLAILSGERVASFRFYAAIDVEQLHCLSGAFRQIFTTVMSTPSNEPATMIVDAWKSVKEDKLQSVVHNESLKEMHLCLTFAHASLSFRADHYSRYALRGVCHTDFFDLENARKVIDTFSDQPQSPVMDEIASIVVHAVYSGAFTCPDDSATFRSIFGDFLLKVFQEKRILLGIPLPDVSEMSHAEIALFLSELDIANAAEAFGLPLSVDFLRGAESTLSFENACALVERAPASASLLDFDTSARNSIADILRSCPSVLSFESREVQESTSDGQALHFRTFDVSLKSEVRTMNFALEQLRSDLTCAVAVLDGRSRTSAHAEDVLAKVRKNSPPLAWIGATWGRVITLSSFIQELNSVKTQLMNWMEKRAPPSPLVLPLIFNPVLLLSCLKKAAALRSHQALFSIEVTASFTELFSNEGLDDGTACDGLLVGGVKLVGARFESTSGSHPGSVSQGRLGALGRSSSLSSDLPYLQLSGRVEGGSSDGDPGDWYVCPLYRSIAIREEPLLRVPIRTDSKRELSLSGCCLTLDFSI